MPVVAPCVAGLLQNLVAVMHKLIAALQPLQQQKHKAIQPLAASHRAVLRLAISSINCVIELFHFTSGDKLSGSPVAATVQPVASLAIMLLRSIPRDDSISQDGNYNDSSSFSADSSTDPSMPFEDLRLWSDSCSFVLMFCDELICAIYQEFCAANNSNSSSTYAKLANTPAAIASADVQRLILVALAAAAEVMRKPFSIATNSESETSDDEAEPVGEDQRHGYQRLLAQLDISTAHGIFSGSSTQFGYKQHEQGTALADPRFHECLCFTIRYMFGVLHEQHQQYMELTKSDSSTLEPGCKAASAFLQQLAHPTLHTLTDYLVLLPDDAPVLICKAFLAFTEVCIIVLHLHGLPQQQQALQWLLQPVYQKVCNAACNQPPQATSSSRSEAESLPPVLRCWLQFTEVIITTGKQQKASFMSQ